MQPDKPRTNISQGLAENFKIEQDRWLQAQMQFKSGVLFYGSVAAALLTSMFYLLPAARMIAKDQENGTRIAEEFVNALDDFRLRVYQFSKMKGDDVLNPSKAYNLTEEYMELDNKYDALVRQFYLIMFETGFSP